MKKVDGIIDIYEDRTIINVEKFYDNLKLSLKYNGQDNEHAIYANGETHFRNAIIEIFERLSAGSQVELRNRLFSNSEDFFNWIYSENNIELGIEKHKKFIDEIYDYIRKR